MKKLSFVDHLVIISHRGFSQFSFMTFKNTKMAFFNAKLI